VSPEKTKKTKNWKPADRKGEVKLMAQPGSKIQVEYEQPVQGFH
jgi:hypothetical protein